MVETFPVAGSLPVGFESLAGSRLRVPKADERNVRASLAAIVDRRAAEYALSVGGMVRIDDKDANLDPPGQLPAGPFRLTQVHLGENSKITDDSLAIFDDCTRLTHVNLSFTKITDSGLAHFSRCKNLRFLAIANTAVTDKGIDRPEHATSWRAFRQNTRITPANDQTAPAALGA